MPTGNVILKSFNYQPLLQIIAESLSLNMIVLKNVNHKGEFMKVMN